MNAISLKLAASCLISCIKADVPPMLWGAPGVGKSDVVRQVAKTLGYNLIDFRATLRDPVDMRGLPLVDAKTGSTRWLAPNELPQEDRDGKHGLLFLDELPNAAPLMQASCFGLVLDRQLGEYKLPKGWVPVAAGNRLADRSAAQRMPTALANRFAHFEVTADVDAWVEWANSAGVDPMLVAFLRFRPELIHKMPVGEDKSFPTPRSWMQCAKLLNCDATIRQHLFSANVGPGPAAELEGFLRVFSKLPSIASILANPSGAPIPDADEPSQFFAVAQALARKATRENFKAVLTYVKRLGVEFEIMTVTDAVRRSPTLTKTEAYAQWTVTNQAVML